ncbi:MAG: response regulator [Deltaproteobacteria bacterium]|nr:response regulator [Deltaproteobacteria bacterium]
MKTLNHGNNGISILCVEDDPTSRLILSQIIATKFSAHKVHCAENGKGGLELFREFRPDIVLTDISMPILDGIRMAAEIRALNPVTRIIAMSGDSELDCQSGDIETLFDGHLLKPIDQKDLVSVIGDCIERIAQERA